MQAKLKEEKRVFISFSNSINDVIKRELVQIISLNFNMNNINSLIRKCWLTNPIFYGRDLSNQFHNSPNTQS